MELSVWVARLRDSRMYYWLIIITCSGAFYKAFSLTFTHTGIHIPQILKLFFVPGFCPAVPINPLRVRTWRTEHYTVYSLVLVTGELVLIFIWHPDIAAASNSCHSEVKRLATLRSYSLLRSRHTPRCHSTLSRSRRSLSNRSPSDSVCVLFCPGILGAVGLAEKSGTQHTQTSVCSAQFPWRLENALALPLDGKENEALFCLPSSLHKASENSLQPFEIY